MADMPHVAAPAAGERDDDNNNGTVTCTEHMDDTASPGSMLTTSDKAERGKSLLVCNFRSVTMSRLAFDCCFRFNNWRCSDQTLAALPVVTDAKSVQRFVEGLGEHRDKCHLTSNLCKVVRAAQPCEFGMTPHHQWEVAIWSEGCYVRKVRRIVFAPDIVFVDDEAPPRSNPDAAKRNPVAVFAVDIVSEEGRNMRNAVDRWYARFGQGLTQLNYMTPRFAIAAESASAPKKKAKSSDDTDEPFATTNEAEELAPLHGYLSLEKAMLYFVASFVLRKDGSPPEMLIGCFMGEPKPGGGEAELDNVRVALLYRKHVCGTDAISAALSEAVQHVCWFKSHYMEKHDWQYLGPHCALVEENGVKRVYRAYDSRPFSISRSSAVYEDATMNLSAAVLLDAKDNFGKQAGRKYSLFDFCGGLKVISVPFVAGSHIPTSVEQLVGLAESVKFLHDRHVVHGDIRLLNMVFCGKSGCLIDYDFAGIVGQSGTVYPPRYQRFVGDGERPGSPGEPITRQHDVDSLVAAVHKVCLVDFETGSLDEFIKALKEYKGKVSIGYSGPALRSCLNRNSKLSRASEHGSAASH